jgi:uncharacterized protein (TIGR02145 family)
MLFYKVSRLTGPTSDNSINKGAVMSSASTFTDSRDGKAYKTVKIGTAVWFAENLNFAAEGSVYYDNKDANGGKYGRLYDWDTALKACPAGWRLPTDEEWAALVDYAGGEEAAGKKLKSAAGWNNDGNGTDEFGFSALPGGYGYSGVGFSTVGLNGRWWSATPIDDGYVWSRRISYSNEDVYRNRNNKTSLLSVRCVQD